MNNGDVGYQVRPGSHGPPGGRRPAHRLRRAGLLLGTLVVSVLAAGRAGAVEEGSPGFRLRSRTIHLPMESPPGHAGPAFPFYQWLELSAQTPVPELSVHGSLWGMGAIAGEDRFTGRQATGDVQLLFGQYADRAGRLSARLGRQFLFASPGAAFFNQIDGLWLRGAAGAFDLQLYGGHLVQPRFQNIDRADWVYGGRAGFHKWGLLSGGLSFMQGRIDGARAREIAGADLTLALGQNADVALAAAYDLVDRGFQEARILARWSPVRRLTLGVGAEQASPSRMIDKNSIFSVFSIGDYAQTEARVDWAITDQWVAGARYARVFFSSESGNGFGEQANRFGLRITGAPVRYLRLIGEADRVPSPDNGWTSLRLAGRLMPAGPWSAAVDLFAFLYDAAPLANPVAGRESLVARVFGERNLGKGFHLGVGGELGNTVLSTADLRGFVRLTALFDPGSRR